MKDPELILNDGGEFLTLLKASEGGKEIGANYEGAKMFLVEIDIIVDSAYPPDKVMELTRRYITEYEDIMGWLARAGKDRDRDHERDPYPPGLPKFGSPDAMVEYFKDLWAQREVANTDF